MTYDIRLMRIGEIKTVAEIARVAFENAPLVDQTIDVGLSDMFSNAHYKPRYFVATTEEDEIVGFAGWNWGWANYDICEFNWCGILPAHQRRGIGRALVEARIADILEIEPGARLILMNTWLPEVYARYGFETLKIYNFRSGDAEHLMGLWLPGRIPSRGESPCA